MKVLDKIRFILEKIKKNWKWGGLIFTLILLLFSFNLKYTWKRGLAGVSSSELKYAEILIHAETEENKEFIVAPAWKGSSDPASVPENTLDNQLEYQLEKKYQERILKEYKARENMKEKAQYAREIIERAREDGLELTLDEDLNVIKVEEILEEEKPLHKYSF